MLNREHVRRNARFQRISGRPLRASDVSIGLEDFWLEAIRVKNLHRDDEDITSICNEIQGNINRGDIFTPDEIMKYAREVSKETGLQYKAEVSFSGDAYIRILFHRGSGYEISISFRAEILERGLERLCNAMNNLS